MKRKMIKKHDINNNERKQNVIPFAPVRIEKLAETNERASFVYLPTSAKSVCVWSAKVFSVRNTYRRVNGVGSIKRWQIFQLFWFVGEKRATNNSTEMYALMVNLPGHSYNNDWTLWTDTSNISCAQDRHINGIADQTSELHFSVFALVKYLKFHLRQHLTAIAAMIQRTLLFPLNIMALVHNKISE